MSLLCRGPARGASRPHRRAPLATPVAVLALLVPWAGSAHAATDAERAAPSPSARPAAFHTALEAAYPAADTVHTGEIREVRLRYTTAVQPSLSTITVVGPDGALVTGELEAVPGSEAREIRVTFPAPLPSGSYTVEWRTAGPDGHPIQGSHGFRVERPPAPASDVPLEADTLPVPRPVPMQPAAQGGAVDAAVAPVRLAVRWLFFASVLGMIGVAAFRLAVAGATAGADGLAGILTPASRRSRSLAWLVGGLALALVPARLALQATQLFGADAWRPTRVGALLESTWGAGWALHAVLAVLFLLGVAWTGHGGGRARGWWVAAVAALGMPLAVALSGHAVAAGARALSVLNDAAHVTAAGLWIGTLACVLLIGVPSLREGVAPREDGGLPGLAVLVAAFSRLALLAVGLLVASGVVSAWLQLGSFGALFTTSWGRTLLVKLALVIPAAALGFYNWRVVRPRLEEGGRPRVFRLPATVELALALGVLLVTAVLVALPRPGGP